MYLDCHTHLLPQERMTKLVRWIHRAFPGHGVPADITPERAVADLRRNGAARWANLLFPIFVGEAPSLHRWGAELSERHPEITPFGGVRADDDDPLGIVEEAVEERGMAGLKFHPMVQHFYPWDDRLAPVLDYLERNGLPMYVHTGYDEWYGVDLPRDGLERMLAARPRLPVVVPHIGFPALEWGFSLADRHRNVWLDLTNVAGSIAQLDPADPEHDRLAGVMRDGLVRHAGRVMMGTDHPAGTGTVEEIFRDLDRFDVPEAARAALLIGTATRFFDRYGRPR